MEYFTSSIIARSLCNTQQITFEITEKCNLKCYYCGYGTFYSNKSERHSHDMLSANAIAFLEYMKSLWKSEYNDSTVRDLDISFYGGEPLLNIQFIKEVIAYVKENLNDVGRHIHYSMTTNAILLHRYIDFLVENDFQLLISLDGDRQGSSYRVFPNEEPAFDAITENIRDLRQRFPEYYQSKVNFNAVLHNRNSVDGLMSFFQKEFDKEPAITELNTSGIREDRREEFETMFKSSLASLSESSQSRQIEKQLKFGAPTYKSAALYLMHYSEFRYSDYNELLYGKNNTQKFPTGTCMPFGKKVFITVGGNILPCERIGHQFTLGKMTANGIVLNFDMIAQTYNDYYSRVDTLCNKCHAKKGCTQCIFFVQHLANKSQSVICDNFMNADDFRIYKNEQLAFFKKHPESYSEMMTELKFR